MGRVSGRIAKEREEILFREAAKPGFPAARLDAPSRSGNPEVTTFGDHALEALRPAPAGA